ncbi:2-nitropropane dioxygenase family protein [Sphingobium chlorophenolicum]|uniref:2-nitropropane dioxygenase family protein n=1 Tax=Sphingobium chlorophenolicum TaxID=46429 RepID=A0A081RBV4_SPHCR|nr:2-nitropropane dioxygenase family protein [Sphingobium chlorophenolicum]
MTIPDSLKRGLRLPAVGLPLIITSLGAREDINDAAHSYGGIVMRDVMDQNFAQRAISKGADGLIVVATGARDHAGVQSW